MDHDGLIAFNTFIGNEAQETGGAIAFMGTGGVKIANNWFEDNSAYNGGALHSDDAVEPDIVENNLFFANHSANGQAADIGLLNARTTLVTAHHNTHVAADATQWAISTGSMNGNTITVTNSIFQGYAVALQSETDAAIIADTILFDSVTTPTIISGAGQIAIVNDIIGSAGFENPAQAITGHIVPQPCRRALYIRSGVSIPNRSNTSTNVSTVICARANHDACCTGSASPKI